MRGDDRGINSHLCQSLLNRGTVIRLLQYQLTIIYIAICGAFEYVHLEAEELRLRWESYLSKTAKNANKLQIWNSCPAVDCVVVRNASENMIINSVVGTETRLIM